MTSPLTRCSCACGTTRGEFYLRVAFRGCLQTGLKGFSTSARLSVWFRERNSTPALADSQRVSRLNFSQKPKPVQRLRSKCQEAIAGPYIAPDCEQTFIASFAKKTPKLRTGFGSSRRPQKKIISARRTQTEKRNH